MIASNVCPTTFKTTYQIPTQEKDLRAFFSAEGKAWYCYLMDMEGNSVLDKNGGYISAHGLTQKIAYQNLKNKLNIV
jgi:hypothetical protein